MTYHCEVERAERVKQIIEHVGLGQIIKKVFHRGCYTCITDTGVTIIKNAEETKVITIYITKMDELVAAYHGVKKIPPYLKKKVDRNQSWYIKEGKTIWS